MGPYLVFILTILSVMALIVFGVTYYIYSTITTSKIRADLKYAFHQTDYRFNNSITYKIASAFRSYAPFALKVIIIVIALVLAYNKFGGEIAKLFRGLFGFNSN